MQVFLILYTSYGYNTAHVRSINFTIHSTTDKSLINQIFANHSGYFLNISSATIV